MASALTLFKRCLHSSATSNKSKRKVNKLDPVCPTVRYEMMKLFTGSAILTDSVILIDSVILTD